MLKFKHMIVVLIALALTAVACEKQDSAEPAQAEEANEQAAAEGDEEQAKEEAEGEEAEGEELAMVDVPADGKKFEPPVEKSQIPAGAWFCDMGTVHYAQMEEGDGSCPACGMKLKKQGEEVAAEEDPHAGHDHD